MLLESIPIETEENYDIERETLILNEKKHIKETL